MWQFYRKQQTTKLAVSIDHLHWYTDAHFKQVKKP
jgi:hypothetical protein